MSMRLAIAAFCATGALTLTAGCVTGPTNGTTVSGSVIGKSLNFAGYFNEPNASIRLEVLNNPTLDPSVNGNWSLFATATSGTSPLYVNSTDPLYAWSVTAAPVPNNGVAARWPQGGLVRVRAVHLDPGGDVSLVTFDDVTFGNCLSEQLNANADWTVIGSKCAGVGSPTAAFVSISNVPVPPGNAVAFSNNGFLGRKGEISIAETLQYYATTAAPATLDAFKTKYGFPAGEVTATYYNDGDLGLGREMHCKIFINPAAQVGVACYVSNYSGQANVARFDLEPDVILADAVARQHAFATVAMVYDPPPATNNVKFVVYDAAGVRANTAQLDSTANNTSIPNNCMACHGIKSTYNAGTNTVTNAMFLPFDPFSFKYSAAPGFTFADQADAFRRLNLMVKVTAPSAAIQEFITGLYAPKPVTDVTAVANNTFVPADWAQATGTTLTGTALYNGVVKIACRTCHMSSTDLNLDFADYADFTTYSAAIKFDTCNTPHVMPHAERVLKKFWESGARAYLITALAPFAYPDATAACDP